MEYYRDDIYRSSAYNNLANLFTTAQLYNEAILLFDKALELETDSIYLAKLFLNKAVAHKKVKQYDKARIDIQNALAIANQLNDANLKFRSANQMGLLAMETQHYDEALLHFNNANKLHFSKKTYVNLGLTYSLKEQQEEAITQYQKAIGYTNRTATKFKAYQYLGNLYYKGDQYELAKNNYLHAKAIYPELTNPDVEAITLYKTLGNCYGKLDLNDLAIESLNFSFDLMKEYNQVRDVLAVKFTQLAFIK
ncbi:MAG: tetratricopeptide repeat protein, partial [Bacteroidota bacterium]